MVISVNHGAKRHWTGKNLEQYVILCKHHVLREARSLLNQSYKRSNCFFFREDTFNVPTALKTRIKHEEKTVRGLKLRGEIIFQIFK